MKILITSGATREPIDKVRFITNMSTGRTGAALAEVLSSLGNDVTYLHGEGAAVPKAKVCIENFKDFRDLDEKLKRNLSGQKIDVVIHAAAVSDYSVENVTHAGETLSTDKKLASRGSLVIKLSSNFKILNRIKNYSRDTNPKVVGFKLTYSDDVNVQIESIKKLFHEGNVDLVVHNDLMEMEKTKLHRFYIHNNAEKLWMCSGPQELAQLLHEWARSHREVQNDSHA